jgi:hypothetical protein
MRGLVPDDTWRAGSPAAQQVFDVIAPALGRLNPGLNSSRWAELPFYKNLQLVELEVAVGKKPPFGERMTGHLYALAGQDDETASFPLNLYRFESVCPDTLADFDSHQQLAGANVYAELSDGLSLTDDTVLEFVRFTMGFSRDETGRQYHLLDVGDRLAVAEQNQPFVELLEISSRLQEIQHRFKPASARVLAPEEQQPGAAKAKKNIGRHRWVVTAPTLHAGFFSFTSYYVNHDGVVMPDMEKSSVPLDGIAFDVPPWQSTSTYDTVRVAE